MPRVAGQLGAKPLTPLWIIATFVSLTEAVLGVALTQSTGGVQVALTTFVCVFPVGIATAFFVVLWKRPYVLYAPSEFGPAGVVQFVEAMHRSSGAGNRLYEAVQAEVRTALTSQETVAMVTKVAREEGSSKPGETVAGTLAAVAASATKRVEDTQLLLFDSRPLLGQKGSEWREVIGEYSAFGELLDAVWYQCFPHLPPFTYGDKWTLRDKDSGHLFPGGQAWAEAHGKQSDDRPLAAVGLRPGMRLELVRPSGAS